MTSAWAAASLLGMAAFAKKVRRSVISKQGRKIKAMESQLKVLKDVLVTRDKKLDDLEKSLKEVRAAATTAQNLASSVKKFVDHHVKVYHDRWHRARSALNILYYNQWWVDKECFHHLHGHDKKLRIIDVPPELLVAPYADLPLRVPAQSPTEPLMTTSRAASAHGGA